MCVRMVMIMIVRMCMCMVVPSMSLRLWLVVHKLDECHWRCVTWSTPELDNARVATGSASKARCDLVEQLLDDRKLAHTARARLICHVQLLHDNTSRVQGIDLCLGHQLLDVRSELLGLGKRRGDAAMSDQ